MKRLRDEGRPGRMEARKSAMALRSSSGSTPCRSASCPPQIDQLLQLVRLAARPGRRIPRSRRSAGRAPSGPRRRACPASWWVTAFQPSFQMPRWPSISKYCAPRSSVAVASAKVGVRLTPCTGICGAPATTLGRRDARARLGRSGRCRSRGRTGRGLARRRRCRAGQCMISGIAHAAAVGVLLVPLQRRVAGLGPAPGEVGVAVGARRCRRAAAPPRRRSRGCR